jgi:hypothetical protein
MQRAVWVEGYRVGPTDHPAQLLGLPEGTTFAEACANLLQPLGNFDALTLTYWGRPLHETEEAARAAYG